MKSDLLHFASFIAILKRYFFGIALKEQNGTKLTSEAFKIVADKQNEVILSSWPFKIAANGWAEALAWNFDEKFQLI